MSGTVMPSHGSTWNVADVVEYGWAEGGSPWRCDPLTTNRYVPAGVCVPRPVSMSESKASKVAVHFHVYEPVAYVAASDFESPPTGWSGKSTVTWTSPCMSPAVTQLPF